MAAKRVSESELAERSSVAPPAISGMLAIATRPKLGTLKKIAEALEVAASDLWPDIATAEMLDDVAAFQEDGHVMTEAEAEAIGPNARSNPPLLAIVRLPTWSAVGMARRSLLTRLRKALLGIALQRFRCRNGPLHCQRQ
jgi:transcriptional regulator with XRE-family HTH domain